MAVVTPLTSAGKLKYHAAADDELLVILLCGDFHNDNKEAAPNLYKQGEEKIKFTRVVLL